MNDEAKKPVPDSTRARLRKVLRTVWTSAVALAMVGGVLLTASASVPSTSSPRADGDLPIRLYGLLEAVTVGETESAPEGVTLAQIVAVLQRADEESRKQGPDFSPAVAQAAAELGMLYTTYQMQQLSFGENNKGLRIEDAPIAGKPTQGDGGSASDKDVKDEKDEKDADKKDSSEDDDAPEAVQVSQERTSVVDPHSDDPQAGYVTYDQLVIAAVRLANMLDPSVPNALVEVEGADQAEGFSLRRNLLDTVAAHGGSTAGYANGRIPTDVLCPLSFAPGHMLRCDAAERLTALSVQFEAEFGYPIPMTDSYRSYELQVAVAASKPHLAAIPGTSNHGWGIAVDLGNPIAGGNSPQYVWMRVHGPDYGWDNPSWARLDGAKPEPWHFEFFAAGSIPNRAIDTTDVGTWEPSDSASPRYKPAFDPKPKDKASSETRKPGSGAPSKKPASPPKKPDDSKPDDSKPGGSKPGTGDDGSGTKPPGGNDGNDGDNGDGDDGGTDPTDPTDPPTCPSEDTEPPCPDDEVDPDCPIEGEEPVCTCPDDKAGSGESSGETETDGKSTTGGTAASGGDDEAGSGDGSAEPDPCPTDGGEETPPGPDPTPTQSPSPSATARAERKLVIGGRRSED